LSWKAQSGEEGQEHGENVPCNAADAVAGASANVSRSLRMDVDCLSAELNITFYRKSARLASYEGWVCRPYHCGVTDIGHAKPRTVDEKAKL